VKDLRTRLAQYESESCVLGKRKPFISQVISRICGNLESADQDKQIVALALNLLQKGTDVKMIQIKLNAALNSSCISQHISLFVEQNEKEDRRNINFRCKQYIIAKKQGCGKVKMNQLSRQSLSVQPIKHFGGITTKPSSVSFSSKVIKKVKAHLRSSVPLLPSIQTNEEIMVPHAFVAVDDLLLSLVNKVYTQQAFHKHFVWFLDGNLQPCVHQFVVRLYFDGFSILDGQPCCTLTLVLLNLPGLIHHPDFNFLVEIHADKEHSQTSLKILRAIDDELSLISMEGLDITFEYTTS
jgi:hypothetical protein